jgi:hypothetical protein
MLVGAKRAKDRKERVSVGNPQIEGRQLTARAGYKREAVVM